MNVYPARGKSCRNVETNQWYEKLSTTAVVIEASIIAHQVISSHTFASY
jgi:hypothetical protein